MKYFLSLPSILICLVFCSCKKFLDEKPNKHLATPLTISDLQLILNDFSEFNGDYPSSGAIASDNYYVLDNDLKYQYYLSTGMYLWDNGINPVDNDYEWKVCYNKIYCSNVVLDNLEKVKMGPATEQDKQILKGEALFFRAFTLLSLSQSYTLPYKEENADKELGIPLRLTSDINEPITRPTLKETFQRIIEDLKMAVSLLPVQPSNQTKPGKAAAFGVLANAYLITRQFENARSSCDSALAIYSALMDYNTLDAEANPSFKLLNHEVIWQADIYFQDILTADYAKVDSNLYRSYDDNDIRKRIYFDDNGNGSHAFKGSYNGKWQGTAVYFCGVATDELYLIRAEALARTDHLQEALNDLNTLLERRWVAGSFTAIESNDTDETLQIILQERRKELCFRGHIRWMDMRRLDQETLFQKTYLRVYEGKQYTLTHNDLHFAFLIPQNVIDNSHVVQNSR